ncbi:MAG: hypothetical protein KGK44_11735 [Gammaproteobacteria bacterium]|nr:hypothetical protein [Gammaproteobacteria bacterium]
MNQLARKHKFAFHALCVISVAFITAFFVIAAGAAQFTSAPTELSLSGVNIAPFGFSVALSANGQVALVGGEGGTPSTPGSDGAYVYTRSNGAWGDPIELSQSGLSNNNNLGYAVALSANGQVALVGEWTTNSAYVYRENNGTWSTPVKLSSPASSPVEFGYSVALSPDGKTAIVSDNGYNSNAGAAYVYTYNGSSWSTGTSLTPSGLSSSQYGFSAALSSNGSTGLVAIISAVQSGNVYVANYDGSSWSTPTALSTTGVVNGGGSFGYSVALSGNGQAAIVGSPTANDAYVYRQSNGSWSNPQALTLPSSTNSFGWAVAMAPSGNEAFVSDVFANANQSGGVYAYTYNGSSWGAPQELSSSGLQPQSGTGWSLAQGANGQLLLVGSPFANGNTGAAYVYESPTPVTLSVTPNPASVPPGQPVQLDFTLTNADIAGTLPAVNLTNLTLNDTLPAGTSYVSSNAANGSCSHTPTTVTCILANLPAGNNNQNPWQPSITISTPSTAGQLTNAVNFSADEPLTGQSSASTNLTNDVPPTVKGGSVSTAENTVVSGTLSATPGYSGQNLSFAIVTQPSAGTVSLTNAATGAFTYTPNAGFSGADSFVFTAGDGIVTSAPGSESISVGASSGGGGSGSSGKSGGGGLGWLTLLLFTVLLTMRIEPRGDQP